MVTVDSLKQYVPKPIRRILPVFIKTAMTKHLRTVIRGVKIILRLPLTMQEITSEYKAKRSWHNIAEITEYRKTIKIYDLFYFFNELDLLEIRLNILDPYVDKFVLVEATRTFSGETKPLHYTENKERFSKWQNKIIHCVIDDVPQNENELRQRLNSKGISELDREIIEDCLTTDNIDRSIGHWLKEFYIKESAKKALDGLNDNDICYISDLDEIWNPELAIDYSKDEIWKPIQKGYIYYLNNRTSENHWVGWTGTVVTKYKNIRHACLNHIRTHKKMRDRYVFLKNGGWHFTFQGGASGARRKIVDSNNLAYYNEKVTKGIEKRVNDNQDYRGRNFKFWTDERGLPQYILENHDKYDGFWKK